jgi:hypothetical protein
MMTIFMIDFREGEKKGNHPGPARAPPAACAGGSGNKCSGRHLRHAGAVGHGLQHQAGIVETVRPGWQQLARCTCPGEFPGKDAARGKPEIGAGVLRRRGDGAGGAMAPDIVR